MSVKFGAKPIEFEKGKAGIVVGSKEKHTTMIREQARGTSTQWPWLPHWG
jgi:hypothetical protein